MTNPIEPTQENVDICSAFNPRERLCEHGFVQRPSCKGAKCFGCGEYKAEDPSLMPYCMRDELPWHYMEFERNAFAGKASNDR